MEYQFKLNDFEGPLDLLLHLIKESKMDIMDIEIVEITNQYLKYIEELSNIDITKASEYLTLASELTYLKSKLLLPNISIEEDEEFQEIKENLVNRLLEYQNYKELSAKFKNLEEQRKEIFTKYPSNLKEYQNDTIKLSNDISLDDLLLAFQSFLKRKEQEKPINTKITTKELSIEEKTISIRNILKQKKKVEFFELFESSSKPHIVVTFLSILEMAKDHEIIISQQNNFSKIFIEEALSWKPH